MKFSLARNFFGISLGLAVGLVFTACHPVKKITPEAARQLRLDWNYKMTAEAYQMFGSTDDKWDGPATNALREFARTRTHELAPGEDAGTIIGTNCRAAMAAGCDDPLVTYLYLRFAMDQTNGPEAVADAYTKMVKEMTDSQYPPIRKFYAAARTMEQVYYAYGKTPAGQATRNEMWSMVTANLNLILADKTTPAGEAADAADTAFSLIGGQANLEQLYQTIEKPLFENWPDDHAVWLFKGTAYVKMAWAARGGGYANQVSADGWKTFGADLGMAEAALDRAWELDTNDAQVPIQMIQVAEGAQKSREEMEQWFARAMAIDPDCYEACHDKLHYLYPQWYGSRDAMVAFGRECVATTNWGGNVPLILSAAHWEYWQYMENGEARSNYWMSPDVWPDIKASFDRFFEVNPGATGYYHNYAWYAYTCGQWDLFLQLIPKLEPVNYAYFGGEEAYGNMVDTAKKHVGKTD